MNYGQLKAEVVAYSHLNNITERLPTFFEIVDNQLGRNLMALELERTAVLTLTENTTGLPLDFMRMRAVLIEASGGQTPLYYVTPNEYAALMKNATGQAYFYTIQNGQLKIGPGVGSVEIQYFQKPVQLVNDGEENLISIQWPELYIYGATAEAFKFVQDMEAAQLYMQLFNDAIASINLQADDARFGGGPLVMRG